MGIALVVVGIAFCLGTMHPALAPVRHWATLIGLVYGIGIGLTLGNPIPDLAKKSSRILLQTAVVLLGFSLSFVEVLNAGGRGVGIALVTITGTLVLAHYFGKALGVEPAVARLIGAGTAICGGSAIAAVSSATDASAEDTAVASATVFVLNAVAMFSFPLIGHAVGLSPSAFGAWAGMAIHDVASVVGAATVFGAASLATATTVKLSRVLYLVPMTLILGRKKVQWATFPWFLVLFLIAAASRAWFVLPDIRPLATALFSCALLLIGLALTRKALAKAGGKPLWLGLGLWVLLSSVSLAAVMLWPNLV